MLGEDVGNVCTFGVTNISTSAARKYCDRVIGWSGSAIMLAEGGITIPGGAPATLPQDRSRCVYSTHYTESILRFLSDPAVLNADGTTDGGCEPVPAAIECPAGVWAADEVGAVIAVVGLVTGAIVGIVVGVLAALVCCGVISRKCFCKKGIKVKPTA